jgi:hypothetical protein
MMLMRAFTLTVCILLSWEATQCQAFSLSHSYQKKSDYTGRLRLKASTLDQTSHPFVQLNEFFKGPVPEAIKEALAIFKEPVDAKLDDDIVTLLTAAPGSPGVPRPLWLVVLASFPTGLLWYGYYKFAVEEELLQLELDASKEPRGFGGYGTLGPFTYGMLLGPIAAIFNISGGITWSTIGLAFIYYTQFLLYARVNDIYRDEGLEEPLQVWWCLPIFFPLNLIVGLRQVHYLSQYNYLKRGVNKPPSDAISDLFPFVKAPRFTWQELLLTPSLWCSFLADRDSIDRKTLPGPVQQLLDIGVLAKRVI